MSSVGNILMGVISGISGFFTERIESMLLSSRCSNESKFIEIGKIDKTDKQQTAKRTAVSYLRLVSAINRTEHNGSRGATYRRNFMSIGAKNKVTI